MLRATFPPYPSDTSLSIGTSLSANPTFVNPALSSSELPYLSYANEGDAWKVTANHVLASVYLDIVFADQMQATSNELDHPQSTKENSEDASRIFRSTVKDIVESNVAPGKCEAIRKKLAREYGYQFAKFVFEKSSLKELSVASKSSPEERRTQTRYSKAWRGANTVEDKPSYWKQVRISLFEVAVGETVLWETKERARTVWVVWQFVDPATKHAFYYNIRTGESRWEKPANFATNKKAKTTKKKSKVKAP